LTHKTIFYTFLFTEHYIYTYRTENTMPSRDLENLIVVLEKLSSTPDSEDSPLLNVVCANLRALAEQVHMLEEIPLQSARA